MVHYGVMIHMIQKSMETYAKDGGHHKDVKDKNGNWMVIDANSITIS